MDISSTCHPGHRRLVCRSGEDDLRKRFASPFLWKEEHPLPRCGRSKYDAGQEIRTGTPEFSEVSSGEVLNIHTRERITDTGRDGRGGFFNTDHLRTLSEDLHDGKEDRDVEYESRLKGLVNDLKGTDKRLLLRAKSTGAWLSVRGTIVSGTVLSAT